MIFGFVEFSSNLVGFYLVLPSLINLSFDLIASYWVQRVSSGSSSFFMGFTGFYRVFARSDLVLLVPAHSK